VRAKFLINWKYPSILRRAYISLSLPRTETRYETYK
jgi:hypothetical protein